jgi:hypothetical protein
VRPGAISGALGRVLGECTSSTSSDPHVVYDYLHDHAGPGQALAPLTEPWSLDEFLLYTG